MAKNTKPQKVQQSNSTTAVKTLRRFKLLAGRFCEGSGETYRSYRPGDIIETTQDLLKANAPGSTKFLLISGDAPRTSSSQESYGEETSEIDEDLLCMTKEELRVMCESREISYTEEMDVVQLAKLIQDSQEVG